MGLSCTLKNEVCGAKCTPYDGIVTKDIIIKKGSNMWEARKILHDDIWCESCRESAQKKEQFTHDMTNYSIGEQKQMKDPKNFKEVLDLGICVWNHCVKNGNCKGDII